MKCLSKDPEDKRKLVIWVKELYDALQKFEPLQEHFDYIDKMLKAALWPTNVFAREAMIGAWECEFTQFSAKTEHDLENAARGFTVESIEDLHRNCNVAARQNCNGKLSRQGRWHVTQRCGVVENLDHTVCEPTVDDIRDACAASLNAKSFEVNAAKFSMGPDRSKTCLSRRTADTYTPGHPLQNIEKM